MDYTFKVFIDGNYYDDDEEYDVEIDLSDEEYATIKRLVDEYDYDFSRGLMPILKDGPENLYHKFYDIIFPHVFFKFFSRDDLFEPVPGDENKVWHEDDFDYLIKTYGDNYYLDEAYIVFIPAEMLPPAMKLSKGMNKGDLLLYIRKWNSTRKEIFDWITISHNIHNEYYDALYEIIEKRLLEIAEKNIEDWEEEYLSKDGSDPFCQIFTDMLAEEIYKEFQEPNKTK